MTIAEKKKYSEILEKAKGDTELAIHAYTRWKCLTDLYFLGTKIMGWENSKKGRRKRVDPVFHRWLARVISAPGDKLICVPRLHLKTTWAKLKIVQDILNNPNIRIGLFSVSARLVEKELSDIKAMLTTPLLRAYFPDEIPNPGKEYKGWEKSTLSELTVKRDPSLGKVPQEPQVIALGSLAKITGIHLDKIYADDIIDKDSVSTAEQMMKSEDWWGYMQSILELDGEVTMTGTFYHYNDLYHKIIREKQFKKIYIRKAIENDKVVYKSWFTKKDLQKIKQRQGNYIFGCQYMMETIPKEEQIFPGPQPIYHELPDGKYQYYITIDPAATTRSYSDQTGLVVAALDENRRIWVVEALGFKKDGEGIAEVLCRKCVQYKPVKVGIEFALQTHLHGIIQRVKDDYEVKNNVRVPLSIFPIPISRSKSKADRIALSMGAFCRRNAMFINSECTDLIHQMDHFTGRGGERDDLVDAASMLFSLIDGFAYQYWLKPQNLRHIMKPGCFTIEDLKKNRDNGYVWRENFVA